MTIMCKRHFIHLVMNMITRVETGSNDPGHFLYYVCVWVKILSVNLEAPEGFSSHIFMKFKVEQLAITSRVTVRVSILKNTHSKAKIELGCNYSILLSIPSLVKNVCNHLMPFVKKDD